MSPKWDVDGAEFLIPDLDVTDAQGDAFTGVELAAFYEAFQEKFGQPFLNVSGKVRLLTERRQTLHIHVKRVDRFTYKFTVRVARSRDHE